MAEPRKTALCDRLAAKLSEMTGTTFAVERGPVENRVRMYCLTAQRGSVKYVFQASRQGVPVGEITAWLASICDMVNMGFIPVQSVFDQIENGTTERFFGGGA